MGDLTRLIANMIVPGDAGQVLLTDGSSVFWATLLGETSATAYRGDRGATAYAHSQVSSGNPHSTSKADLGLGNVDNTSDASKPISTATQSALDLKADLVSGKIPASQLPTYVDDVLEYDDYTSLPGTGNTGVLYLTLDDNALYRWSGSAYVAISSGSGSLVLGTTSTTAHRGDHGSTAYTHSQLGSGNPHNVSKSDVSLGNCNNTSDLDKPISTATQSALDLKAAISTVLTKTNTDAFTPSANYHPATKKYVDDNAGGAVDSVNSQTGAVVLTQDNVGDGTSYVRTENNYSDAEKSKVAANDAKVSFPEAPTDGGQYARKSSGWSKVAYAPTEHRIVLGSASDTVTLTGMTPSLTLTSTSENIRVYVGGLYQSASAYTKTNTTTLTFDETIPVDAEVIVETFR